MTLPRATLTLLLEELTRKRELALSLGTASGRGLPLSRANHEAMALEQFQQRFVAAMPIIDGLDAWDVGEAVDAMLTGMAHYGIAFGIRWRLPVSEVERPLGAVGGPSLLGAVDPAGAP